MSDRGAEEDLCRLLTGSQLEAVIFVRDYVQLQFDSALVTAVVNPILLHDDVVTSWHDPGYRDLLCKQIDRRVTCAVIVLNSHVELSFEGDVALRISLLEEDYRFGPEAITVRSKVNDSWWVY